MEWMQQPDAWAIWTLIAGAVSFVATHYWLSHPPVRTPLIALC